ncbi:hypothetical protein BLNAU_5304 [Blattamonas nauphoetae]|uniref:Uncharacterized protein n=1 Tax=Blattamonas nauphoetae TaxID=2049346 RepID=A0ABQ9Y7T5_9EUKA|nr:hypothetical protein BLNAU_5304 [Blattamonas nauphoetae]
MSSIHPQSTSQRQINLPPSAQSSLRSQTEPVQTCSISQSTVVHLLQSKDRLQSTESESILLALQLSLRFHNRAARQLHSSTIPMVFPSCVDVN